MERTLFFFLEHTHTHKKKIGKKRSLLSKTILNIIIQVCFKFGSNYFTSACNVIMRTKAKKPKNLGGNFFS